MSALDPSLVQQFVGAAHGDLEVVKDLMAREPALVRASWDWGGGDFETALGASAHMGRRDIAEALLSNGAVLDLFSAAMLGDLAVVQEIVSGQPSAAQIWSTRHFVVAAWRGRWRGKRVCGGLPSRGCRCLVVQRAFWREVSVAFLDSLSKVDDTLGVSRVVAQELGG